MVENVNNRPAMPRFSILKRREIAPALDLNKIPQNRREFVIQLIGRDRSSLPKTVLTANLTSDLIGDLMKIFTFGAETNSAISEIIDLVISEVQELSGNEVKLNQAFKEVVDEIIQEKIEANRGTQIKVGHQAEEIIDENKTYTVDDFINADPANGHFSPRQFFTAQIAEIQSVTSCSEQALPKMLNKYFKGPLRKMLIVSYNLSMIPN